MGLFPTSRVTASFIGVFLVGVLVGALMTWSFTDRKLTRFMSSTSDPVSMASRINQKYNAEYELTPEEQARIAPLTQEMAQHLYQLRHQFGADVIATFDEYHQKIAEQMTPAHAATYTKDNEERRNRMSALLLLESPKSTPDPR